MVLWIDACVVQFSCINIIYIVLILYSSCPKEVCVCVCVREKERESVCV